MVLIDPDSLSNSQNSNGNTPGVQVKVPKRVLHFSDGILEEYSSDEEELDSANKDKTVVDPSTLTWGPWLWYKAWLAGNSTLSYMDAAGEFLAAFFGITTPRYYFEMEEYKRHEAEIINNKEEKQGWSEPSTSVPLKNVSTKQPEPVAV